MHIPSHLFASLQKRQITASVQKIVLFCVGSPVYQDLPNLTVQSLTLTLYFSGDMKLFWVLLQNLRSSFSSLIIMVMRLERLYQSKYRF